MITHGRAGERVGGRARLVVASYLLPGRSQLAAAPVGSVGLELAELGRLVARRDGCWVSGAAPARRSTSIETINLFGELTQAFSAGQCESTLGPLWHGQPAQFDRRWSEAYRSVNRRHASVVAEVAAPGASVLVYDYHLQLVPAMLRLLRPDLKIVFAFSGGFPPAELFCQLPDRAELIAGLLGADVIAVAHRFGQRRILDLAHELTGRPNAGSCVDVGRRLAHVIVAPTPADTATVAGLAAQPAVRARAVEIRASLNADGVVFLSVAGPSDAEGVEQRMSAFDELLRAGRLDPDRDLFVHLAVGQPRSEAQRQLRARIERLAARLNAELATVGRCVVRCVNILPDAAELTAYYLAADVLAATPAHSGPVAVAAEFAAARGGRIVLSDLTTTAADLPHAILVNPRDSVALRDALADAAAAPDPPTPPPPAPGQVCAWLDDLLAMASPPPLAPTDSHVPRQQHAPMPTR